MKPTDYEDIQAIVFNGYKNLHGACYLLLEVLDATSQIQTGERVNAVFVSTGIIENPIGNAGTDLPPDQRGTTRQYRAAVKQHPHVAWDYGAYDEPGS